MLLKGFVNLLKVPPLTPTENVNTKRPEFFKLNKKPGKISMSLGGLKIGTPSSSSEKVEEVGFGKFSKPSIN